MSFCNNVHSEMWSTAEGADLDLEQRLKWNRLTPPLAALKKRCQFVLQKEVVLLFLITTLNKHVIKEYCSYLSSQNCKNK